MLINHRIRDECLLTMKKTFRALNDIKDDKKLNKKESNKR